MEPLRSSDPAAVGPYRLQGRLGTGGMGVVYLGVGRDSAPVAIKMIRAELAGDEEFRARFTREAMAASRVDSPYTALVADADLDCPQPWMATEYVPGPSLQGRVTSVGQLRLRELVDVGAGIASGLAAIHGAGLVHRDVKPSNIILSAGGPRIIDFGIAYMLEATTLTRTEMMIGSPGFLSPEQVRGAKVTPASDVFSFGATLVYAAAGRSPFGSGPAEALLYRVVHENADLAGVPTPLTRLLQTCLAKNPRSRPSAEEVLDDLHLREKRRAAASAAASAAVSASPSAAGSPPEGRTPPPGDAPAAPGRPPASRPVGAPRLRPSVRAGGGRGRAFVGRLVIFSVATGAAALVITVVPKVFGATPAATPRGSASPSATSAHPTTATPRPSPSAPTTPPALAPPPPPTPTGTVGPGAVVGTALATVDWSNFADYRDYSAGGSPLPLVGGFGSSAGQPVTLSAEVPISLGGAPAMVVVLTKQPTAAMPAGCHLVHVFGLAGNAPTLLGGVASPADPDALTRWRMDGPTLVREQDNPGGEAGTSPVITRYAIAPDGSVTPLGTAAP